MKRHHQWFVAFLALGAVAIGQQSERVEAKVVGPIGGVQVIQVDDPDQDLAIEVTDVDEGGTPFLFRFDGQDADEKGAKRKGQDEGTIVKEIDLGDGRKMKIVITTEGVKHGEKGEAPKRFRPFTVTTPDGKRPRAFGVDTFRLDPHGFDVKAFGGDVKGYMDRALRAFDRARAEFIRTFEEDMATHEEHRARAEKKTAEAEHDAKVADIRAKIEEEAKAQAGKAAKMAEEAKKQAEATKKLGGDIQWLGVTPGATSKQAQEIEELRKEIKELQKAVRALKEGLSKKDKEE
jgi:hypothetical protein